MTKTQQKEIARIIRNLQGKHGRKIPIEAIIEDFAILCRRLSKTFEICKDDEMFEFIETCSNSTTAEKIMKKIKTQGGVK